LLLCFILNYSQDALCVFIPGIMPCVVWQPIKRALYQLTAAAATLQHAPLYVQFSRICTWLYASAVARDVRYAVNCRNFDGCRPLTRIHDHLLTAFNGACSMQVLYSAACELCSSPGGRCARASCCNPRWTAAARLAFIRQSWVNRPDIFQYHCRVLMASQDPLFGIIWINDSRRRYRMKRFRRTRPFCM